MFFKNFELEKWRTKKFQFQYSISPGLSYLDGFVAHLPQNFLGYKLLGFYIFSKPYRFCGVGVFLELNNTKKFVKKTRNIQKKREFGCKKNIKHNYEYLK